MGRGSQLAGDKVPAAQEVQKGLGVHLQMEERKYRDYIGIILGLYCDNGKGNGNYQSGFNQWKNGKGRLGFGGLGI